MTEVVYFENEKTKKRYKLVEFDQEAGMVRLQGPNRIFNEPYSKERFKEMGYKLVKVEEEDAEEG